MTGDIAHRDFGTAVNWLEAHTQLVPQAEIVAAARQLRTARSAPRLIVVALSRPGQFSSRQIESLHEAAPLARLICLLGSWCEGETRSGRPWPGVERIYWHEFPPRMAAILANECAAAVPRPSRTATVTERLLATGRGTNLSSLFCRGLVGIHASRADYQALADTCRSWGFSSLWLNPQRPVLVDGVELLLWNGESGDTAESAALRDLARELKPAAVAALLTFPRGDDVERMQQAGAGAVLTKPFLNGELRQEVERLLPAKPIAATDAVA